MISISLIFKIEIQIQQDLEPPSAQLKQHFTGDNRL